MIRRDANDQIFGRPSGEWAHPDNAPTHRFLLVSNYLSKHPIPVLPQSVNSPDLAPCDFFPFHRMQNLLKGQQFSSSEAVQRRRHWRRW
ncbi:hypothetical protein AVEN_18057-1 [Araneus ventricosus]|uniref:Tc1-like transposase DDE domain-containing protein n=1 Tax=Araneus ventricosus TaxID=182803 RepID=A0A4Y2H330_ARAVE|nr:hypothetical protein AVEN_18057-1 [Araneus ventricosus]